MSNIIKLTTMNAVVDNRKLEVKDGYYLVRLGAFNIFNSVGEYYPFKGIEEIINNSEKTLNSHLTDGDLRAEINHPVRKKGWTDLEFIYRNLKIDMLWSCAHIKEIVLDKTDIPSGYKDDKIVYIDAWIKPMGGNYGDMLKASLDNPEENTNFSIRCLTDDRLDEMGINIKHMLDWVTHDWVNRPGIKCATKWDKLSVESEDICEIDIDKVLNHDGKLKLGLLSTEEDEECTNRLEAAIEKSLNNKKYSSSLILDW